MEELNIIEALLAKAGDLLKPVDPGVSADVELGVLLIGIVGQLFNHHKAKISQPVVAQA